MSGGRAWIHWPGVERHTLSYDTGDGRDKIRRRKTLSPRVANAARYYASGIVATKAEAAIMAGLKPATFYQASAPRVADMQINQLMTTTDSMVADDTIDTSRLIQLLSRKAIGVLGNLMNGAAKEEVKLRAAIDLADRGAETSKIHKHQVESFTLSGVDAKRLAEGMVEAARVREANRNLATDDFIKLEGGTVGKAIEGTEGSRQSHEAAAVRQGNEDAKWTQEAQRLLTHGD